MSTPVYKVCNYFVCFKHWTFPCTKDVCVFDDDGRSRYVDAIACECNIPDGEEVHLSDLNPILLAAFCKKFAEKNGFIPVPFHLP